MIKTSRYNMAPYLPKKKQTVSNLFGSGHRRIGFGTRTNTWHRNDKFTISSVVAERPCDCSVGQIWSKLDDNILQTL